jgi:hypothetical protein
MTVEVYFSSKEGNLHTNWPSADQWQRHWENICADVAASDVLLFMSALAPGEKARDRKFGGGRRRLAAKREGQTTNMSGSKPRMLMLGSP